MVNRLKNHHFVGFKTKEEADEYQAWKGGQVLDETSHLYAMGRIFDKVDPKIHPFCVLLNEPEPIKDSFLFLETEGDIQNEKPMRVKDLIDMLYKYDQDARVYVSYEGKTGPEWASVKRINFTDETDMVESVKTDIYNRNRKEMKIS